MKIISSFKGASLVNSFSCGCIRLAVFIALPLSLLAAKVAMADDSPFYLKAGDRVCFYGDSITEQRFYGVDVETFVRTRFPNLRVEFVNSGVGGDRVTGGWAGPIDERLDRDVFPFKPNVVTIMLGMNDAEYRPFDEQVFETYTNGYEHIIRSLQLHLPGVRIVLIQPTPYDDITESPKFAGGYNGVLQRYADFVRQLADEHHLMCVDFMTPMLDVMQKAEASDPSLAHEVIPGRVHPSAVGELLMAQALLKAWNAPATVTAVTIDAAQARAAQADNTSISDVKSADHTLSWNQDDRALPFPILGLHEDWPQFPPVEGWGMTMTYSAPAPDWGKTNAAAQMIVDDSGFYDALDQEPLKVTGLDDGNYQLKINGQTIGDFSAGQLGQGINLAAYHTPMLEHSYHVLSLVWNQVEWRFFAWRNIQLKLSADPDPAVQRAAHALVTALLVQKDRMEHLQFMADQPKVMHYELDRIAQ